VTVQDQVWEDLVGRKQFASARQISRKLRVAHQSVRVILLRVYLRVVMDMIVKEKTNYYRIKQ
jgi:hypothetical protein